jgi:hypothetical protein
MPQQRKTHLRRKSITKFSLHLGVQIVQTNMTLLSFLVLIQQTLHLPKQLIIIQETLMIQYSNKYTSEKLK